MGPIFLVLSAPWCGIELFHYAANSEDRSNFSQFFFQSHFRQVFQTFAKEHAPYFMFRLSPSQFRINTSCASFHSLGNSRFITFTTISRHKFKRRHSTVMWSGPGSFAGVSFGVAALSFFMEKSMTF